MADPSLAPLRIGDWRVDPVSGVLSRDGRSLRLDARPLRLLIYLARRAGQVISIEELLDEVWAGVIVTPDSVYQAVTSLRRQLGDDSREPRYIATVPRLGYRLVAVVSLDCALDAPVTIEVPDSAALPGAAAATWQWRRLPWLYLLTGLGLLGLGAGLLVVRSSSAPVASLAVLPLLDLTTQEMNEEFFADGLTEELIGDLSRTAGLRVPGATASFLYRGSKWPPAQIAQQLGVAYLLDGSVRKSGTQYRVSLRLMRADGFVLWSNSYERPLGDLLSVQKSVAAQAASAIGGALRERQGAS